MAVAAAAQPTTGTDGAIAALPDELLREVFSRVGSIKCLFRFAVTSRRWLRLFADPAFLRRVPCPSDDGKGRRGRLLGFAFQRARFLGSWRSTAWLGMRMAQRTSVHAPSFLPTPGSPLGATLTSLAAADDDGTFNYAEPLAVRHGIILIQLVPRVFDDLESKHFTAGPLLLALCNPTTGERHVLPPLVGDVGVSGCGVIVAADGEDLDGKQPSSSPTSFSHLVIFDHRCFYVHWYSAATRSWGKPTKCRGVLDVSLVGDDRSAAVHRGAAHWLCKARDPEAASSSAARGGGGDDYSLYKLSAELGTERVSMAKLPIRCGGTPLLQVGRDDKLSIACVYPLHVTVWTQQDEEEDSAWLRTQVFRLPMAAPNRNDPPSLRECLGNWFGLDRGAAMLVLHRYGGVFILDLEEEVMDKVMDSFPSLYSEKQDMVVVPYEMDLVEFFVSRLGGLLCRG